uniref:Tumor necrosis factor receptor superfamily, member 9a n=2 Tax=Astyanax mexicanus TaxID=7994 RepID=A0A8B9KD65_ASTMX
MLHVFFCNSSSRMKIHLTLWSLCHLPLIVCLLGFSEAQPQIGCADWELGDRNRNNVCCRACHPGNRLVTTCGPDPTKLCEPCEANRFITHPIKKYCDVCRVCTEPQIQLKACTAAFDTVCGCEPGLRCGDQPCSFCVDECGKGQEPVKRGCRTCPTGTFNDKIHSSCKPWRSSCPDDKVLVAKGDAFSDIKCKGKTKNTTVSQEFNTVEPLLVKTPRPSDDPIWPIVGLAASFAVGTIILILSLGLAYRRRKNKTKAETKTVIKTETMDPMPETSPIAELRVIMVEPDDACSFRQPEQEQGGSLESIDSENSESKLIV